MSSHCVPERSSPADCRCRLHPYPAPRTARACTAEPDRAGFIRRCLLALLFLLIAGSAGAEELAAIHTLGIAVFDM